MTFTTSHSLTRLKGGLPPSRHLPVLYQTLCCRYSPVSYLEAAGRALVGALPSIPSTCLRLSSSHALTTFTPSYQAIRQSCIRAPA